MTTTWRGHRSAVLAACALMLVTMASCRIPEDKTVPGATPTPPTTLTVEQRFGANVPLAQTTIVAKRHGEVVYQGTLTPVAGAPTPSPLTSGVLEPGSYNLTAIQHACAPSCDQPGEEISRCAIGLIVEENQPLQAIIHINRKGCFIEVG